MKRQPTDWEKILACNMTYNGLVFNIYKHFMRFNNIKTNNPVKKWTKELTDTPPKKTYR